MNARIRQATMAAGAMAILFGSVSCGNVARTGRSPVMLVVVLLTGEPGSKPGTPGVPLYSDVVTLVKRSIGGVDTLIPTIFSDQGHATLRAVLKDQGAPGSTAAPSSLNEVTVSRYHIVFVRSDGHNTPGVDVPYAFDGALTATIGASDAAVSFELVRHQAKEEAPLKALAGGGGLDFISTIAQVTFYGQDLTGNDVQATGTIGVNFADFGDPL